MAKSWLLHQQQIELVSQLMYDVSHTVQHQKLAEYVQRQKCLKFVDFRNISVFLLADAIR
jgi:hypothetical protein